MVDINQIAVQVQMRISTALDRGVGRLCRGRRRREIDLGEETVGRDGHLGEGLGSECRLVDDDFLDVAVGGLRPGGG